MSSLARLACFPQPEFSWRRAHHPSKGTRKRRFLILSRRRWSRHPRHGLHVPPRLVSERFHQDHTRVRLGPEQLRRATWCSGFYSEPDRRVVPLLFVRHSLAFHACHHLVSPLRLMEARPTFQRSMHKMSSGFARYPGIATGTWGCGNWSTCGRAKNSPCSGRAW